MSIFALNGSARMFFDAVQMYARRPKRSFRPPSASLIMCASSPAPAITANRSPLIFPTSSTRSTPRRPISTAFGMSDGISRLEAKRLAVPAGMIASVTPAAGEHVDRLLHHPVAAPHEHELGAFVECPLDALGGVLALRHLRPDGIVDPLLRRGRSEAPRARRRSSCRRGRSPQPSSCLPFRRLDVMDASAASRCAAAAPAARAAKIVMQRAAMPMSTPAATSVM